MSEAAVSTQTNSAVVYRSEVRAVPSTGGIKFVSLPAETQPVPMGMHGGVAAHYKLPEGSFTPRAATLDYLVGGTAACLLGTLARALRVREINSDAEHLTIDAVGEHESEDGVLVLKRIHVVAHLRAPASQRETVERVFQVFASKCPMHQSIRKAIDITTELDFQAIN
jgi:organic hydroperoxide reductase OsmC/OhrA